MVILDPTRRRHCSGSLLVELLVAMALLTAALLPLAYSLAAERRLAVSVYQRSVAMEIVDGETEILSAGAWRNYTNGVFPYKVHAAAATNLPPGKFLLTRSDTELRLEWRPDVKHHGGAVVREVKFR